MGNIQTAIRKRSQPRYTASKPRNFNEMPVMNDHMLSPFIEQWIATNDPLPTIQYQNEWPSPCVKADNPQENDIVSWQPVPQSTQTDMFDRLSDALEIEIHPAIVEFYSGYWSDPLAAQSQEGELVLLQAWSPEDMERLRSNLIGHALAKRKMKHPLTFFFACTEPDDGILSIANDDGSVWLEYPGKRPTRQIEESLPAFIQRLSPRPSA